MIKNIDIATMVSITTGVMLTEFIALHDAVQFATGQTDDLASIGVAMMAPMAKDVIMSQYPDLPETLEGYTDLDGFLLECRERFGESLAVSA